MNNAVWQDQRDALCDALALESDPTAVLDQLTATLDAAWRETALDSRAIPTCASSSAAGDEIVLTPLDADDESDSLIALRAQVEALLPAVEIADLPLEVHGWTGFLDEYTHISGTPSSEPGLPETLSALLVSESCNIGLTPVAGQGYPPLTRERLNWVAHNYLRSATHAAANTRLVDHHTPPPLAQAWGGGEMASAGRDTLRHPGLHHPRRQGRSSYVIAASSVTASDSRVVSFRSSWRARASVMPGWSPFGGRSRKRRVHPPRD
jgi:hypothetical protein